MTITKNEIAAWFFYLKNDSNSKETNIVNQLVSFNILIHSLKKENLLIPRKVTFLGKNGNNKDLFVPLNDSTEVLVLNILKQLNQIGDVYTSFVVKGQTELLIDNSKDFFDNILEVGVEFSPIEPRFYINTYSDCWLPIDRDENLQIDLAIDASHRLEKCLNKIDSKISIKERFPDVNEEIHEYLFPQRGNRIYTKSTLEYLISNKMALKYF